MITIGIDPGWASCGVAVHEDGKCIFKKNFEPRAMLCEGDVLTGAIEKIWDEIRLSIALANRDDFLHIDNAFVERFVAYEGIHSKASEEILMFIGAMVLR